VPEERRVAFWGVDLFYAGGGVASLRDFLDRAAPERLSELAPVFDKILESDDLFPNARADIDWEALGAGLAPLDELIDFVRSHRDGLVRATSRNEVDSVETLLTVMRQWSSGEDVPRSRYMGENLVQLLDRSGDDTKVVFWAHNGHVDRDWDDGEPSAGGVLFNRYGSEYTPWRVDCQRGSWSGRERKEGTWGLFGVEAVLPRQADSLQSCLARTGLGDVAVDLRPGADIEAIAAWRATPPAWPADPPPSPDEDPCGAPVAEHPSPPRFDGIVFVSEVSPAHPTSAAVANAASGWGI
jgi:erythromycin esterase